MMLSSIRRRDFLKHGAALAAVSGVAGARAADDASAKGRQEFYELRVYRVTDAARRTLVGTYLEKALLPALERVGLDRVGVFAVLDKADDYSLTVLIPYPTLDTFGNLHAVLRADGAYQEAAAEYFACAKDAPAYARIESKFLKAFAGMPVIELPAQSAGRQPRIFELRTYESHNEERAARKVDMFNDVEMQIMRDVGMAPVFYGEALIGCDIPNLTYMLSAPDMEAHQAHWKAFLAHPEWARIKGLPEYKDTVSKITKVFFAPAACSRI